MGSKTATAKGRCHKYNKRKKGNGVLDRFWSGIRRVRSPEFPRVERNYHFCTLNLLHLVDSVITLIQKQEGEHH